MKSSFYYELLRENSTQDKLFGKSQMYVEFGMYYEQVKKCFIVFRRGQVKVIIFEEFIHQPEYSINEVLNFLGIDYKVTAIREQYNQYSVARSPLSLWIFALFRWLRTKNIKFYKILTLLPNLMLESLPEKILFKRKQKPEIDPKAVKSLLEIYHGEVIRLELLICGYLSWPIVLGNNNKRTM